MMQIELQTLPKEVAEIVKKYLSIAIKREFSEATVMYHVLKEAHEADDEVCNWVENNIVTLAQAIHLGICNAKKSEQ